MLYETFSSLAITTIAITAIGFVCNQQVKTPPQLVLRRALVAKKEWFKFSDKRIILQSQIVEGHVRGH